MECDVLVHRKTLQATYVLGKPDVLKFFYATHLGYSAPPLSVIDASQDLACNTGTLLLCVLAIFWVTCTASHRQFALTTHPHPLHV